MAHLNGPKINFVMMRTIMLPATSMEVPVVDLMSLKTFAQNVNVFKVVQEVVVVQVVQVKVQSIITSILSRYNPIHFSLRGQKLHFPPKPRSGKGENM